MLIYRVETAAGIGVYSTGLKIMRHILAPMRKACHPLPLQDGIHMAAWRNSIETETCDIYAETIFGFNSQYSMEQWFDADFRNALALAKINEKNYLRVNVYKVPKKYVMVGKSQVIFLRTKAEHVMTLSLGTLEELDNEKVKKTAKIKKPNTKRPASVAFI